MKIKLIESENLSEEELEDEIDLEDYDDYDNDYDDYEEDEFEQSSWGDIPEMRPYFESEDYFDEQLDEIYEGLRSGVDVSVYANPNFAWAQMEEIRYALEKKLSPDKIKLIAQDDLAEDVMDELIDAFEKGLTAKQVAPYMTPEKAYSYNQCREIFTGLLHGLPDDVVASYGLLDMMSSDSMEQLREIAEAGGKIDDIVDSTTFPSTYELIKDNYKEFRKYFPEYNLDIDVLDDLAEGLGKNLDLWPAIDEDFESEQIQIIIAALEKGLDVSWFADPIFDEYQMNIIKRGLEEGVDVSIFAYPRIPQETMYLIEVMLEKGENIYQLAKQHKFNFNELLPLVKSKMEEYL